MTESTSHPLFGLWKPRPLQQLFYGPDTVKNYLMSLLPQENSKAFIITGTSLATKSPLIKDLESTLGSKHHAGTFSKISQHAPIAQLDEATDIVQKDPNIDTIISVGGGSPIDSAKAISYRVSEKNGGKFLHHIAIPTTLSAAECTAIAGYTLKDGTKQLVANPSCAVAAILYDPEYAKHTPTKLWIGTGMRAIDHAMELMINPTSSEVPCKVMNMYAASKLHELLPKAKAEHPNNPELSTQLFLAAYASLGFWGMNAKGGIGLSHSLGYALGSPYGIPHGETSCLTLGHVVKLKAKMKKEDAEELARMLPHLSGKPTGDVSKDAQTVGDMINQLIDSLEMRQSLTDRGVGKDQVEIITQRATGGQKEGPLYDEVKKLVEGLY